MITLLCLLLIAFCYCVNWRPIFMNVSYIPDFSLLKIEQGNTIYDAVPSSNYTTQATFSFKGFIGDKTIFFIKNDGSELGLTAVLHVGTSEFTTDNADLWKSEQNFLHYDINGQPRAKRINDKEVKAIGATYGYNTPVISLTFQSSTEQTYCSNVTPDGEYPSFVAYTVRHIPLPLEEFVYPIGDTPIYWRVDTNVRGNAYNDDFQVGATYVKLNKPTFMAFQYGPTFLMYFAKSKESESSQCFFSITICFESCKSCDPSITPDNRFMQCIECFEGYAQVSIRKQNCLLVKDKHKGVQYDPLTDEFICDVSCNGCEYNPADDFEIYCTLCNNADRYYHIEYIPHYCYYVDDFLPSNQGFYLDQAGKVYRKCTPDICEPCNENQFRDPTDPKKCICKEYSYKNAIGTSICVSKCSGDKPYQDEDRKECLSSCEPNAVYEGKCIEECPLHTKNVNGVCIKWCFPETEDSDLREYLYIHNTIRQCIEIFNANIKEYLELDKPFTGVDFSMQVYDMRRLLEEKHNLTLIDFSQCERLLRDNGQIAFTEAIIIAKIDIFQSNSTINQIEYNAYTANGQLIDLSICKDIGLDVFYPILSFSSRKFKLRKKFIEKYSLDIHNPLLSFYNDNCFPFVYKGKDTTLADRRRFLFVNQTFCERECTLSSINYATNRAECSCKAKTAFNQMPFSKQVLPAFPLRIPKSNVVIAKCYFLLLKWNNLANSIAFWIMSLLTAMQLIGAFSFLCKAIPQLLPLLYQNEQKVRKLRRLSPKPALNKVMVLDRVNSFDSFNLKNLPCNVAQSKDYVLSFNNSIEYLQSLSLNQAIQCGKDQNLYSIFLKLIKQKSLFIRAFAPISQFELFFLSLSRIILNLTLSLLFNAFLFRDSMISFNFLNNYFNPIEAYLNTLYASIISAVTTLAMKHLIAYHQAFDILNVEIGLNKGVYSIGTGELRTIKLKCNAFLLIELILMAFTWYYCTLFCTVYNKTQFLWVGCSIITIINSLVLLLIICSLIAAMKYASMIFRKELLFKVAMALQGVL